jgi:putative DNA primase/helicase
MSLDAAMQEACRAVGIVPPRRQPQPGRWARTDTGQANGKGDASVMLFPDGTGGIAWNWQTQERQVFRTAATGAAPPPREAVAARRAHEAEEAARHAAAADAAARIVAACQSGPHPYLAAKGFPDEPGLVSDDPRRHMPHTPPGEAMRRAFPEGEGPWLVVPARIGGRIVSVQFIGPNGAKKNLYGGAMDGACHRIASGRETWVCEGIATALSVRAALRLLGRPATVLATFSAANAAKVARGMAGSVLAADHDKPIEHLGGLGTGEFYARASGRPWAMPPERGDWNDWHQAHGLRAVAMLLREVRPP